MKLYLIAGCNEDETTNMFVWANSIGEALNLSSEDWPEDAEYDNSLSIVEVLPPKSSGVFQTYQFNH